MFVRNMQHLLVYLFLVREQRAHSLSHYTVFPFLFHDCRRLRGPTCKPALPYESLHSLTQTPPQYLVLAHIIAKISTKYRYTPCD